MSSGWVDFEDLARRVESALTGGKNNRVRMSPDELRALLILAGQAEALAAALRRFEYVEDDRERPWLIVHGDRGELKIDLNDRDHQPFADAIEDVRSALGDYEAIAGVDH